MVTGIIFSAIAALAYAVGSANDSSNEQSSSQARIRFVTVRISELIKHAKLVTLSGTDDLAIWTSDSNGDNQINPGEVAFIETGPAGNYIWLLEFQNTPSGTVDLEKLADGSAKSFLISSGDEIRTEIIPQCSNVTFNPAGVDHNSSFVCISFDITVQLRTEHYQISSNIRSYAGNLIDGSTIATDDD